MSLKAYTGATPNGYKLTIYLELLGLKYETIAIDISKNTQKEDWFLNLNPNGRIPTLVDESTGITIGESGAILAYLADTYDKERKFSYEFGTKEYYKQLEVTTFQMAGVGPMQGQANHFVKYAPEKVPYGIERYTNETKRLYSVLEEILIRNDKLYNNSGWLVGDHISIADVVTIPWAFAIPGLGIEYKQFPRVKKWIDQVLSVDAVKRGLHVPKKPLAWYDELPSID